MKRLVLILILLLLPPVSGVRAEEMEHPVKAEAVMLKGATGDHHLGVRFRLREGWHIYWRNPGEAGLPTEIEAHLPEGVSLGDWQWPLPESFESPGPIASYGYEHEVILAAPLSLSENSEWPQENIQLAVSWLACKDRCILGSTDLNITLPLPPEAQLDATEFEALLPKPEEERPFDISVENLGEGQFRLSFSGTASPKTPEWFPIPGENLLIDQVQITSSDTGASVTFHAESLVEGPSLTFPSLVVVHREDHSREGWPIHISLPLNPIKP